MITSKAQEVIRVIGTLSAEEKNYVLESLLQFRTQSEIQEFDDLRAQYPDEWVAVILPDSEDRHAPQRGYLVAHHPERARVWQQIALLPSNVEIYVFFTGVPSVKGFGIAFHDATNSPDIIPVGS